MLDHPDDDLLLKFRDHLLRPVELLAVDRHLSGCESCRSRLRASVSREPQPVFLQALGQHRSQHLTFERMDAYADGRLDIIEKQIVEGHAELCAQCRRELKDLRNFASMMEAAREVPPLAIPSVWEIVGRVFSLQPVRFAAAVAAVVLVVTAVAVVWKRPAEDAGPIAQNPQRGGASAHIERRGSTETAVLTDAQGWVYVDRENKVHGLDGLPAAQRRLVERAVETGTLTAKTSVGTEESAQQLAQTRKAYPDAHLVLGVLYAHQGILEQAEREFQLLLEANPESTMARSFLQQVKSLRGRNE